MAWKDWDARTVGDRLIVAVEGGCDDWAAYEGAYHADDTAVTFTQNVLDISDGGDKLTYLRARLLFPDWDGRLAWRA